MGTARGETAEWMRYASEAYWPTCIELPYNPGDPYGRVTISGITRKAAVWMLVIRRGPRPYRRVAAHWCGNKRCVNWRHLRWATSKDNRTDRPLEYR